MKLVKVMIKDSEGKIESVKTIEDMDEIVYMESWDEDEVDAGLDVLTGDMPWFFASEKDGKLHGYDFEIEEVE